MFLALASLLSAPSTSFGYDLPKQQRELAPEPNKAQPAEDDAKLPLEQPLPAIPLEVLIPTPPPGNTIYPIAHCCIAYVECTFGKGSWDYTREMQLRDDIAQKQLWLDIANSETPRDKIWVNRLSGELNGLMEELQNLVDGRPIPEEKDPCLVAYRACLLDYLRFDPTRWFS